MQKLNAKNIKEIFTKIKEIMDVNKDMLFNLDSKIGDGDIGISMSKGFLMIDEELKNFDEPQIGKIFMKAGMVLSEASPSTAGTLIADGLINAGICIQDKSEIELKDLVLFFSEFINRIIITGKAVSGEKTIVDSLYPAAKALEVALKRNKDFRDSFNEAYDAAKKGYQSTKEMVAKYGRAKWYGDKSIGVEDPGAAVGMLFIEAFYNYFKNKNN